jgi:FGGY-family pentulose kinase
MKAYLGLDVGTGSARAALFDTTGRLLGRGQQSVETFHPYNDFVEQSSEDIWHAVCAATARAIREAALSADAVAGIGFGATGSLVALDERDQPVTMSPTGSRDQNVILWMDHRASAETEFVNRQRHEALRYVGGNISIEMQVPKLLWVKQYLPETWQRAAHFFDLPDFLTYRATGEDIRSHCSLVCKWNYLGHENQGGGAWPQDLFDAVGLGDLLADGARRIGADVRPLGTKLGSLSLQAAQEMGLRPGTPVGVSIIHTHASGLSLLGMSGDSTSLDRADFDDRLALIGGTSTCHMAVSPEPRFVPGIGGPYFNGMLPGMWLHEGWQSATGALLEHTINSHVRASELRALAHARGRTVYQILNELLDDMASELDFPADITRDVHVLPYHDGNRSPRADPTLRGMISGLRVSDSLQDLAALYLATIQAIAHGTRHVIETLNMKGYKVSTLVATSGEVQDPVFLREHADVTGCEILLPASDDVGMLGTAMLGAMADAQYPSLTQALAAMGRAGSRIQPSAGRVREYHDAKHRVFFRMYHDQQAYRTLMSA